MYGLNSEQDEAILAASPTLVNASAGSGKTRTLIAKIMHSLDSGARPEQVLAVTFTNKAANEMKERLKKHYDITGMQISTIHSMCVRIMKEFIGYTPLRLPFSIYDDGDQISIVKTIMKARGLTDDPYDFLEEISNAKSTLSTDKLGGDLKTIYEQYRDILLKNNACDFEDLQVYALSCLEHEDCANRFTELWQYILVDEMQDVSDIQYQIILKIWKPEKTRVLFWVGDMSQGIYGWRNARPENMNEFIKTYQPCVKYLTYNYRSCPEVITQANIFQQFGKPMIPKSENKGSVSLTEFNSREEEAERITLAIMGMRNFNETAILYRVNARSLLFEQSLARHQIPYKVVGDLPFFRRKVIKDLICALKSSVNPSDIEALSRIINNPKRGFGDAKKERLFHEGRKYAEEIAKENIQIRELLDILDTIKGMKPYQALSEYLNRSGYMETVVKDQDRYLVEALRDVVTNYDNVQELVLASNFIEEDKSDGVKLMTAHASKGLEFDRVFVVGLENGLWPHENSEDIDEEYRLFYVACTRARRYLNISYSKSRTFRGQPMQCQPSPLFKKIYSNLFKKDMQY